MLTPITTTSQQGINHIRTTPFGNGLQRLDAPGVGCVPPAGPPVNDRRDEYGGSAIPHQFPLPDHPHQADKTRPPKRRRGRTTIASLNMKGFGALSAGMTPHQKWLRINQLMRDEHIAILALQETHLDETRETDVSTLFESSLRIMNTADRDNPTAAKGTAIVLNKRLISHGDATSEELIPGRAIEATVQWGQQDRLRILAI